MAEFIVVHSIKVAKDFTPETFGRLTAIGPRFLLTYGTQGGKKSYRVYQCSCGNVCISRNTHVKNGLTKSCGCLQKEVGSARGKKNVKHGGYRSVEYGVYTGMKKRCGLPTDKSYSDYGGRGITVCDRWLCPVNGFLNFLADMGPRPSPKHSIERKLVNGNYCPDNCYWATTEEQARNKRNTHNMTYNGKTQCLSDWAKEFRLRPATIRSRIKSGWTVEKALTTPVKVKSKEAVRKNREFVERQAQKEVDTLEHFFGFEEQER